jgi:hypothetical protein
MSSAPPRSRILAADYLFKLGGYTTRLSTKIKSKEITDASAVTRVSALNVP